MSPQPLRQHLQVVECELIRAALEQTPTLSAAARHLSVNRAWLHRRAERFGLRRTIRRASMTAAG